MPLIQWLLAAPHYICRFVLSIGAAFVMLAAFFAVIFTGRFPRGMWDYLVGVHRWGLRLSAYSANMTDHYPPFSLHEKPHDAIRLGILYPDRVARWRPVAAWLLVLPHALIGALLTAIAGVISFLATFTILFTRRYPPRMFNLVRLAHLWNLRTVFYAQFMVERYPPFRSR